MAETPLSAMDLTLTAAAQGFAWDIAATAIAWPGDTFKPPDNGPWAEIQLLFVLMDDSLQTASKARQILQIDLSTPMNQGTLDIDTRRDALLSYFAPRRLFTYNGQSARVRSRDVTKRSMLGGWASVTLSITFDAVLARDFD